MKTPSPLSPWLWIGGIAAGLFVLNRVLAANPVQAAVNEAQQLQQAGIVPTYPDSAYAGFADAIYQAGFVFGGTDEDAIFDVFSRLENRLDLAKLIVAFGERRVEFSLMSAGLGGWLRTELDNEEIGQVNAILAAKGINYAF